MEEKQSVAQRVARLVREKSGGADPYERSEAVEAEERSVRGAESGSDAEDGGSQENLRGAGEPAAAGAAKVPMPVRVPKFERGRRLPLATARRLPLQPAAAKRSAPGEGLGAIKRRAFVPPARMAAPAKQAE